MSHAKLVIGNKNYSSWSMRPWLLLKAFEIPFDEINIALYQDNTAEKLGPYSPSLKVPAFLHTETTVWDSLAICEYISEQLLEGRGWPINPKKRASARSVCAEMHAEFPHLKKEWPMNCKASVDLFVSEKLEEEIARLKANVRRIPFIDEIDLRYRQHLKKPQPATSAVMFCLMDVSGSMTQMHKDIAKRFFILLYLFLKKNYKKIEVVFIRHHTSAKEVDEEEFFYSRETGGTIVSSALKLMHKIIESRYSPAEWNIYAAQASDGDNWNDDSPVCGKILADSILPLVQYFAYVEITPQDHQMLWYEYEKIQEQFPQSFALQQIADPGEIYPVFRQLFERKAA